MSDPDRKVKYVCLSPACGFPGDEFYSLIEKRGCQKCGCMHIEIYDFGVNGHIIVDWRSPKSLRKKGKHPRPPMLRRS